MTPAEVIAARRSMPSEAPRIWIPLGLLMAGIGVAPALGLPTFLQSLAIEMMIFAILALSLNILLGYTGLVSFGHAAFFAIAGYGFGVISNELTTEILVSFPLAVMFAALCAVPLGWLSIRLSGFYFLMITFAFAQMVFVAAFRWTPVTGGSDGLIVSGPTLFGAPVLSGRLSMYLFVLAAFALSTIAIYLVISSRFGRTLVGIRESTPRMRALGYNVRRYKLAAFVVGAVFAAVAGVLNVQFNLFIAPESAHWTQSALIIVMVLIGGASHFIGPVIGAALVIALQHGLSSYTEYWGLVLGTLYIIFITGAREGIAGLAMRLIRRNGGRRE